jgi:hypothetical protein
MYILVREKNVGTTEEYERRGNTPKKEINYFVHQNGCSILWNFVTNEVVFCQLFVTS